MSTIQSMKAAITTRVNTEDAFRLFGSRSLGAGAFCPSGAPNINVDEYGRPVGGTGFKTLYLNDPACSNSVYSIQRRLRHENAERPILGPCNPGNRGGGDFLYGNVRTRWPEEIYGNNGDRGEWGSPYVNHMLRPPEGAPVAFNTTFPKSLAQPYTLSHDALDRPHF